MAAQADVSSALSHELRGLVHTVQAVGSNTRTHMVPRSVCPTEPPRPTREQWLTGGLGDAGPDADFTNEEAPQADAGRRSSRRRKAPQPAPPSPPPARPRAAPRRKSQEVRGLEANLAAACEDLKTARREAAEARRGAVTYGSGHAPGATGAAGGAPDRVRRVCGEGGGVVPRACAQGPRAGGRRGRPVRVVERHGGRGAAGARVPATRRGRARRCPNTRPSLWPWPRDARAARTRADSVMLRRPRRVARRLRLLADDVARRPSRTARAAARRRASQTVGASSRRSSSSPSTAPIKKAD